MQRYPVTLRRDKAFGVMRRPGVYQAFSESQMFFSLIHFVRWIVYDTSGELTKNTKIRNTS